MTQAKRIKMLERALIRYVELYGLTEEARVYFELPSQPRMQTARERLLNFICRRTRT